MSFILLFYIYIIYFYEYKLINMKLKPSYSPTKSLDNFDIIKILGEGSYGKALLVKTKKGRVNLLSIYYYSFFISP